MIRYNGTFYVLYPKYDDSEDMPKKLLDLEMRLNGEIATTIYQKTGFVPRFYVVESDDTTAEE